MTPRESLADEPETVCDACGTAIPEAESQTCSKCGGVLCNECYAAPACPGNNVIGFGRHK